MEREISEPIGIALPNGNLRREAVGWARHPLLRCNLQRGISRFARWNYWCITSQNSALTIVVGDVGYFGFALISFLDFAARGPVERVYVRPLGLPFAMPDSPGGDIDLEVSRLQLHMRMRGDELHIDCTARTLFGKKIAVELAVTRPPSHETVNVLVPWDETRFHFTSKQQALPARGVVRIGSREHRFAPDNQGFACLDFGRGRWPDGIEWNWAFASQQTDAHTLGLNLGGKWTDGTGVTENAVVIDGRLHKISDEVDFEYGVYMKPWRIRTRNSSRVDLRFDPRRERVVKVPLGIAGVELHQMVGVFSGTFIDDTGAQLAIRDMLGLAESVRGRW